MNPTIGTDIQKRYAGITRRRPSTLLIDTPLVSTSPGIGGTRRGITVPITLPEDGSTRTRVSGGLVAALRSTQMGVAPHRDILDAAHRDALNLPPGVGIETEYPW